MYYLTRKITSNVVFFYSGKMCCSRESIWLFDKKDVRGQIPNEIVFNDIKIKRKKGQGTKSIEINEKND